MNVPPLIVLIEDNHNTARMMLRLLEKEYSVLHARDGETGLQLIFEHHPDLILLDLGLPDVDGQTVAAHIRQTPELDNIPVVVVTAWPAATAQAMVTAYNCNGYVPQPIDTRFFAQQVTEFLAAGS